MNSATFSNQEAKSPFTLRSAALWSLGLSAIFLAPIITTSDFLWGAGNDLPMQHHPLRELGYQALRNGEWPLWNPYSGSGLPYQTGFRTLAYPVHLFGLFFSAGTTIKLSFFLHTFLAIFFMMATMRFLGFSRLGSIIAGATFGGSGFMLGRLFAGHIDWFEPVAYVPLLLWTFLMAFRYRGIGWTLLCGGAIGWMGIVGHYQPIYITLVAVLGLLAFLTVSGSRFACPALDWADRWSTEQVDRTPQAASWTLSDFTVARTTRLKDLRRFGMRVVVAGLVAAGATLFRLLPSVQSALHSNRLAAPESRGGSDVPLSQFLSYIIPHFFEGTDTILVWARWPSWETQGYLGVVILVLVSLAWRSKKESWLAPTVMALFGLSVAAENKFVVYPVWHAVDPLLQNFSAPGRFVLITLLFVCWLGALGFETLNRKEFSIKKVILTALPWYGVVLAVSGWMLFAQSHLEAWASFVRPLTSDGAWNYLLGDHSDNLPRLAASNFQRSLIPVFLVTSTLICLTTKSRLRNAFLLLLVLVDLVIFARPYLKTDAPVNFEISPELNTFLSSLEPGTRVQWSPDLQLYNRFAAKQLSDLSSYDYFADKAYVRGSNVHNGAPIQQPVTVVVHNPGGILPNLQGAGVVLSSHPLELSNLKYLKQFGNLYAYQNLSALPRAFALTTLWSGDTRDVLIQAERSLETLRRRSKEVKLVKLGLNQVELEVDLSEKSYLILTDAPWPGWHVRVDGEQAEMLVVNAGLHRGVQVGSGQHKILFYYWPQTLTAGLIGSGLTGILILILIPPWGWPLWNRQHQKHAPTP